ncbi:MAG: ECF transporter S component [Oscillospiraceae bacterium]
MEAKKETTFTVRRLAVTGLMAALVFAGSWIQIPMPGETRLHLGNVMCLLSGFILGPVFGGLSAGIGSAFFDLTNPLYIDSLPFTLVFKFLMAFVAGLVAWGKNSQGRNWKRNVIGGILGVLCYVILYVGKNFIGDLFFLNMEMVPALLKAGQKGLASLINAIIAVIASVPLAKGIRMGLDKAGISLNGSRRVHQ